MRRFANFSSGSLRADDRVLGELEDVAAEEAEARLDGALDHAERGHHADDREDADGHAEHRQRRAKLVRPQRAESHAEDFGRRFMAGCQLSVIGCRQLALTTGHSFVPQRLDRIQPRRRQRRGEAGEDAGQRRDDQADDDQADRELHRERRERRGDGRATSATTAPGRPRRRSRQIETASIEELQQDRAPPRADRFARADLARPLFHADVGDVHDADGADEERQAGDEEARARRCRP